MRAKSVFFGRGTSSAGRLREANLGPGNPDSDDLAARGAGPLFFTSLTHGLAALAGPGCLLAFLAYTALTAILPLFNRSAKVGGFLNTCVLTLGTPALTVFLTLSAAHAMLPRRAARAVASGFHVQAPEVAALLVLGIALCSALVLVEFASVDARGLPCYLVGVIALRLFFDANAPRTPDYPSWLAAAGIFALVAFFAILLRLVANEEVRDVAGSLRGDGRQARSLVRRCLTPALNFIPAILGVCLYGAAVGFR
jgi:hypothetical protein